MAFDDVTRPSTPGRKPESTDDMVALGHQAGHRPVTRKIERAPIPKEARRTFFIGIGLVILVVILVVVRTQA